MAEVGRGKGKAGGRKERAPTEPGPARLQRAAARAMGRNCGKLTQVLLDKALEGHLDSTKLLVALAEPKKTEEKLKTSKGLRVAQRLALQPSWDDDPLEEKKRILLERGEWERYEAEVCRAEEKAAARRGEGDGDSF